MTLLYSKNKIVVLFCRKKQKKWNFEAEYLHDAPVNILDNDRGYSQGLPKANGPNHWQNLWSNLMLLCSKKRVMGYFCPFFAHYYKVKIETIA